MSFQLTNLVLLVGYSTHFGVMCLSLHFVLHFIIVYIVLLVLYSLSTQAVNRTSCLCYPTILEVHSRVHMLLLYTGLWEDYTL